MKNSEIFEEIVKRSRLSRLFAASCVRRACEHVGKSPGQLALIDLPVVLPEVERAVRTFHDASTAEVAIADLRQLLQA